ncbi:MAG: helix-turn-helix transcriptional regulator [Candidatus Absconditabacterales bacterium]|nr:helix-turn-helix transcriptional regulator [Candidatus Absconditabacterales bacterium]
MHTNIVRCDNSGHIRFIHGLFQEKLKLIGDFWSLLILMDLKDGPKRFSSILSQTDASISPATLSHRLKNLVQAGFLFRREKTEDKQSVMYELTPMGNAFLPILHSLETFVRQYFCSDQQHKS